jgi:hypothetical protein
MTTRALAFLSEATVDMLREKLVLHVERYVSGNFNDLAAANGWQIETKSVELDEDVLGGLDGSATSPEVEVKNSLLVHQGLKGMTRALAREERIWTRLTHMECLSYARARWLTNVKPEAVASTVETHFFARTVTQVRDDNAISRLWWNAEIARIAAPEDPERALRLILSRADIRLSFVERARTVSRPKLAQGIIRIMESDPWVLSSERSFREFMKVLNRNGGGLLFEIMDLTEVDALMQECSSNAQGEAARAA